MWQSDLVAKAIIDAIIAFKKDFINVEQFKKIINIYKDS